MFAGIKKMRTFASQMRNKASHAPVAYLVAAPDLGSGVVRRVGSSPIRRTKRKI